MKMDGFCIKKRSEGVAGCPGRVPLVASGQCKSHRIYAHVKAKIEAQRGQGSDNVWIKAVNNVKKSSLANVFTQNVRNSQCSKECCSIVWTSSQQVPNLVA